MKNRKLLLIVSLVLAMTMSLGGTLAYLTDADGDVNVMTVGRVEIVQNEQDREGNAFKQEQQMLPVVGDTGAKDANGYRTVANYIDKIVTVTNTGNTDAWVRTLIAFPELTHESYKFDDASTEVIHWNGYSFGDTADEYPAAVRLPGSGKAVANNWWWGTEDKPAWPGNSNGWNVVKGVEIGGLPYTVYIATNVAKVASEETTAPNLVGIYMDSRVDYNHEEECYTWETDDNHITFTDAAKTKLNAENVKVYVLSQAVQAGGFDNAWDAFDEAFKLGETPATTVAGWFADMKQDTTGEDNVPPVFPTGVSTFAELKAAFAKGGEIKMLNDIESQECLQVLDGIEVVLDMNGKTLYNEGTHMTGWVRTGGKLTITGNGTMVKTNHDNHLIYFDGELNIMNGTFEYEAYTWKEDADHTNCDHSKWNPLDVGCIFCGRNGGNYASTLNIYGGTFDHGIKNPETFLTQNGEIENKDMPVTMYPVINTKNETIKATVNVYGGTFVEAEPVYGDVNGPHTIYLVGQTDEQRREGKLPAGYTVTKGETADGRTTYTYEYTK